MSRAADLLAAVAAALGRWLAAGLGWAEGAAWRGPVLAGLVAAAVALPGIAALPVTDRDEGRFAQATKQMIETGDYVDIRFQDQPRWKKPAGIYWLQAGVASLAGGAEAPIWAYRIPSALSVILAAMAAAWAARPLVGGAGAALAGLVLATPVLVAGEANIAKTDAALLLTATLVFGALARALTGQAGRATWLVFWVAIAAAILLKGPIVPLVALLAVFCTWAAAGALPARGSLKPLYGLPLAALLAAPWLVAIWIVSDGAFFRESVGEDLLAKVAEGQEKHWGPPGLYLLLIWATFWPWAAFLPGAIAGRGGAWRTMPVALLAAWVVPFWIVLELVPTKLPHYVLPLFPAMAALVAAHVLADEPGEAPRWRLRASAWLAAVPGAVLGLAAFALPLALEGRMVWPALLLGLPGALLAIAAGIAARRGAIRAQAAASLVAALLIYPAVLQFGLPNAGTVFPTPRIVAMVEPWRACSDGPVASLGYREPSLVFHLGTDTRLTSPRQTADMLRDAPGTIALVEARHLEEIRDLMGPVADDLAIRGEVTYFNPNRGKWATNHLVTRDGPRWEPCGG